MNVATSSLFSQLLSLVDRNGFAKLVRETGSERRSKGFASWDVSGVRSALQRYLLRRIHRCHSFQIYEIYEVRLPYAPASRCGR